MIQQATVVALAGQGRAKIKVKRQSACGHDCETCGGGCGSLAVMPTIIVEAENLAGAKTGDIVTVASSSKKILGIALLVYMVPLVLFLVGYGVAANVWLLSGGGCAAVGVLAFVVGGLCAVLWDRHTRKKQSIHYSIVGIEDLEH